MIFYKLLCIPPNFEIFVTSIYTTWCLCSTEILSFYQLINKINVWSTIGLEDNLIVTYLRYAVSSVHIFQFIFAYIMLVAEILTIYPILFNNSAKLLNPIIIASTIRQIYLNCVSVVLGGLLCYFSGSNFIEFQIFFGKFLLNIIFSYYIIFSYKDFREYIRTRSYANPARVVDFIQQEPFEIRRSRSATSSNRHARSVASSSRHARSEVTSNHWKGRSDMNVELSYFAKDSINPMHISSKTHKILPNDRSVIDSVDSSLSIPSMPTTADRNRNKETFVINLIDHKTKAGLVSYIITKQN